MHFNVLELLVGRTVCLLTAVFEEFLNYSVFAGTLVADHDQLHLSAERGAALAYYRVHIAEDARIVSWHLCLICLLKFHFFDRVHVENRRHVEGGFVAFEYLRHRVVLLVELPHFYFLLTEAAIDLGSVVREKWVTLKREHVDDVEVIAAVRAAHNVTFLVVAEFPQVAAYLVVLVQDLLLLALVDC